jgi:hypothetical protein
VLSATAPVAAALLLGGLAMQLTAPVHHVQQRRKPSVAQLRPNLHLPKISMPDARFADLSSGLWPKKNELAKSP